MREPIFVYEPDDLDIFATLSDAERKIEPIDVLNGGFAYYDAEGRVLSASVQSDASGVERTVIRECGDERFEKSQLREILLNFLIACGVSKFEIENLSLEEMVGMSVEFATQ